MFATDVVKDFFGGPGASVGHVIEPLADSFFRIRTGGDVEQALVRLGILHDGRSLSLYSEYHGALAFLQLLHEVAGTAPEGLQPLDGLGNLKHGHLLSSTFLCAIRLHHPRKLETAAREG